MPTEIKRPAGASKDMKDYMDGKISKEVFIRRVKKETNLLIRTLSLDLDTKKATV